MAVAVGLSLYIVEGTNPGFIYQVEAFDPEDTSRNTPLSVSLRVKLERGFSTLLSTQEPGVLAGRAWALAMGGICCPLPKHRGQGRLEWARGLWRKTPQTGLLALCDLGQGLNLSELQFFSSVKWKNNST